MPLPLERASRVLAAARLEARRLGLAAITVVILDADGAVRLAAREDGQGSFSIDIARAKAATALGFGRSSQDVATLFTAATSITALAAVLDGRFLPVPGAVPIAGPHGIEGAIGVAGAAGLNDQDGG
jgi:uncharacterized protein GlcG (DUF336 family)